MAEQNINVTVTMPVSYAAYIDRKAATKDQNRSQVVRAMIRKDMEEDAANKPKKVKGGK
jgi:Arc/MetJ-type ribon-helix-helix transcriptional regulator